VPPLPHHPQRRWEKGAGSLQRRQDLDERPDAAADYSRRRSDAAFGDALDEQELANLLAYLHSCRDKKKKGN